MASKNMVYFINELVKDKDNGYIPCIAVEGETGFYKTDWNWGTNLSLATQLADEKNLTLGFTQKEAMLIVLGTMKGK